MIKINNTAYYGSKIVLTGLFEGDIVELESDSNVVTWEIVKHPTTEDRTDAVFLSTNRNTSTLNEEQLPLDLVGTYYIKAIERSPNGSYSETKIYIRSNSMLTRSSLPFNGEKDEINSRGWGEELLEYVLKLTNLVAPLVIFELDGGFAEYSGSETVMNGGHSNCVFGFIIDGGTAEGRFDEIDGGTA